MTLHASLSETAEKRHKRAILQNKLISLAACLGLLGFGGLVLCSTIILINYSQPTAFETYVSPSTDKAPSKKPKLKELSSKESASSTKVAPSILVAAEASEVSMATIDVPTSDVGVGNTFGFDMGLGDGFGNGLGGNGSEGFGSSEAGGSALEGTFYDLKLSNKGADLGATIRDINGKNFMDAEYEAKANKIVGEFLIKGFPAKFLDKYYQSPHKLYISHFLMGDTPAELGPKAFNADKKVKPFGWCVVYRGKVKAPKTGKFRFVGFADDFLVVRFNKELVLEAGYQLPSLIAQSVPVSGDYTNRNNAEYPTQISTFPGYSGFQVRQDERYDPWTKDRAGLIAGKTVSVVEGREYPIEIVIAEIVGGEFRMILLTEDLSSPKSSDGQPAYDLFRTSFDAPKEFEGLYNEDSYIWSAWP